MKNRKTALIGIFIAIGLIIIIALAGLIFSAKESAPKSSVKIGVLAYNTDDTFISGILAEMEQQVKAYEQKSGIRVYLDVSDAGENQRVQNEQAKRYISLDYDILLVNIVDRTNASSIIDAVTTAGMPTIFFNREPVEEDIQRADNLYYVGSDAKESAVLQGEILAEAWQSGSDFIDKNKNGKLDYVLLEGELGHQDATIRTKWVVQTLNDLSIPTEKLQSGVANWSRSQAAALCEQWITLFGGENIEVVIANNDDMALGAVDTLSNHGIEDVMVVGIDATSIGVQAVKNGKMLGTVNCNTTVYADTLLRMANAVALQREMPKDIAFEKPHYVRIPLEKLTAEALAQH